MDFIVRHRTIVAFTFFTLFCIVAQSVGSASFTMSVEGVGSALVSPFQKMYGGIHDRISIIWEGYSEFSRVKKELAATQEKLLRYESLTEEISEIKRENSRLRSLVELKQRIPYESVPASVIGKDPDNWFRTLVIDKGERDGVAVNMPVLSFVAGQKAVVGKISEVRGGISRIIPIISPEMKIGILLQETRFPGLMSGFSANTSLGVIQYVSKNAPVKQGDVVITSGQGGVFPPGLLIGRVLKTEVSDSSAYQRIVVKPALDYNLIEEVFIIKKSPDPDLVELSRSAEN